MLISISLVMIISLCMRRTYTTSRNSATIRPPRALTYAGTSAHGCTTLLGAIPFFFDDHPFHAAYRFRSGATPVENPKTATITNADVDAAMEEWRNEAMVGDGDVVE